MLVLLESDARVRNKSGREIANIIKEVMPEKKKEKTL